ncbi:MAG: energy transducer TonB family protein [Lentimonas sp.]
MPHHYKAQKSVVGLRPSLLIGLVCALAIFLLVPITQLLREPEKTLSVLEAKEFSPPPPPPLEEPPPPPKPEEEPPPPDFEISPPMPTLEQLELSLNPGIGEDLSFDSSIQFDLSMESADELSRLFGFDELDEVPRLVRQGRPKVQQSAEFQRLIRRGGAKEVILEVAVSPQGVVTVQNVLSSTHEALIPAAKQAAEGSRFSAPTCNGQAVRASYVWPLKF